MSFAPVSQQKVHYFRMPVFQTRALLGLVKPTEKKVDLHAFAQNCYSVEGVVYVKVSNI